MAYAENVLVVTAPGLLLKIRDRYVYANTSLGGFNILMETRPLVGQRRTVKDFALTFNPFGFTVDGNGHFIQAPTGAFVTKVLLKDSGNSATWEFDQSGRWLLVEFYRP